MKEIPKDEIQYWNVVHIKGEQDRNILVGIVHDTELDYNNPDFKATPLHELIEIE